MLCSLKGFLHLLPEFNSSTFYHSWKNLYNSFGKGVQCKHSLHNIRALNLRFLLKKVTLFTVWLLPKKNSSFPYHNPISRFILKVWREIFSHKLTRNNCLLAFVWPVQYLMFQKQFAHVLHGQGSMKWLVPSIIAKAGESTAYAGSLICISNSWIPTPSTLPLKLFRIACKDLWFYFSLLIQRWTFCWI